MAQLRETLAHNLKKKRRELGLTQAQLAEKVSVSTHHIAMIETARDYPALDLLERIADTMGIEVHELFIAPLSTHIELDRLYQTVAKNIEDVVSKAIQKTLVENYIELKKKK